MMYAYLLLFLQFVSISLSLKEDECEKCKIVAEKFIEGMKKSDGKNFGGGNTLWEQTNLGSYATSEIRLHEILDELCEQTSLTSLECHKFMSRIEDQIEEWWATSFKKNPNNFQNIFEAICVMKNEFCCSSGRYGPSCDACLPCSEFGGTCDGNETRGGTGICNCHPGYTGKQCDDCNFETHYVGDTISTTVGSVKLCLPCHRSCSGCSGPTSRDCVQCAKGWSSGDENSDCIDINECQENPCSPDKYCLNTIGSYECNSCNSACNGCSGPSANDCVACAPGYQKGSGGSCEDINECSVDSNACKGYGETCRNTMGSFTCECKADFKRVDGVCKPVEQRTSTKPSEASDFSNNEDSYEATNFGSPSAFEGKFSHEHKVEKSEL